VLSERRIMDIPESGKAEYARVFDAMAEVARKEADVDRAEIRRKALWGVAAGLEMAAALMRNQEIAIDPKDASLLMERYKPTHYAYLVKKEPRKVRKTPPNLNVTRVVKGKQKPK
jgi:hypothetical protein